jgi:benzoyl-CoA reductase/2-hydroxyglutaryl-CoA dehydratase subunit BcrC/BadD/HgdB
MLTTQLMGLYEDYYSAAKSFGFTPEVCSAHRLLAANVILGWLPRPDAFIWSNQVCDNTAKSGDVLVEQYDCPGFFLDRPYRYVEREVKYFTRELENLVRFLEEITHRKMDWDRLKEVVKLSEQSIQLQREISQLRKAVPAPMRSRGFLHNFAVDQYLAGTPEAVSYMECVRDEVKAKVEQGQGAIPEEKYRILTLFLPPMYLWKLVDWMEREHGAVSVMEPYCSHWGEGELDIDKPLEALARKSYYRTICRPMHGPAAEGIVEDTVQDATDYKAEGAVYFAHIGCRQADGCIRILKDALREEVGIPMLVVDNDICDPSYASEELFHDQLEGFFEMLDERK